MESARLPPLWPDTHLLEAPYNVGIAEFGGVIEVGAGPIPKRFPPMFRNAVDAQHSAQQIALRAAMAEAQAAGGGAQSDAWMAVLAKLLEQSP